MRIPEVQDRLRHFAQEWGKPELEALANELRRRSPKRKAPNQSEPMTEQLRDQIRRYARSNPNATQVQIGVRFNVNPGRVSEALRGFRT